AYANGLYGEVYLNLFFFVPTGIIGYVMWYRHLAQDKTVEMRQLDWLQRCVVIVLCIGCTLALGSILSINPQQNTPFIDATTNVLSVVATFLMMWRYKEQWLLYIVLNMVTIGMWFLRFRAGGAAGDLMILMWSLFLLNALFGYWRWHVGTKRTSLGELPINTEVG
ncbi:nicotinamide mononucleotide transporter, partial [Synechococcus moorigangaii CMS01]|nr:nicotinamide mononucleotide transporter [Synechococcus moorigangaii CMS01]